MIAGDSNWTQNTECGFLHRVTAFRRKAAVKGFILSLDWILQPALLLLQDGSGPISMFATRGSVWIGTHGSW